MNLQIKNARNPKYTEDGNIEVEIEHPQYGWIPFTASPDDCEEHGRQIYKECMESKHGKVANYTPPPPPTDEQLAEEVRIERDNLLNESDWSQLPDVPSGIQTQYKQYRQALRDVTEQEGFPKDVTWPEHPKQKGVVHRRR